jgi:prepilin-type N-terminal cleavage/methylation domain-containing protein
MLKNKIKQMRTEGGFTLVELLVVILIIGILATLAIVAFSGSTDTAEENTAQGNLRSALAIANNVKVENGGSYSNAATEADRKSAIATAIDSAGSLRADSGADVAAVSSNPGEVIVYAAPSSTQLSMGYKPEGDATAFCTVVEASGRTTTDVCP